MPRWRTATTERWRHSRIAPARTRSTGVPVLLLRLAKARGRGHSAGTTTGAADGTTDGELTVLNLAELNEHIFPLSLPRDNTVERSFLKTTFLKHKKLR